MLQDIAQLLISPYFLVKSLRMFARDTRNFQQIQWRQCFLVRFETKKKKKSIARLKGEEVPGRIDTRQNKEVVRPSVSCHKYIFGISILMHKKKQQNPNLLLVEYPWIISATHWHNSRGRDFRGAFERVWFLLFHP